MHVVLKLPRNSFFMNYEMVSSAFKNVCNRLTFEELAKYLLSGSLENKTLTLW